MSEKYRMYVDEVGNSDMNSADDPNHRFLSLTGVILELLEDTPFILITVVIDKKSHKEQYSVWRYDPYHYCLAVLVERYFYFLSDTQKKGDIMAESRGGKEDLRLKKSFRRIIDQGTDYISSERLVNCFTSKELKVKPKSANVSGLQICDLIAHPSRREILIKEKLIVDERKGIFGDKVVEIIEKKYYQKQGNIYGRKTLP